MRKIRLGNDFILKLVLYKVDDQLVLNNEGDPISGTPEDLTLASNLILKIYNIKYRKEYRLNTSVNINIISSEILQNIQQTGQHYIVLEYDLTNPEFLNGLQHFKVGLYAFEILSSVSDAELVDQIIIGSCVSTGGESGKSAYEIAVENGFVGTEQEWLASLSPNTDNFATKTELSLKANLTDIPSLVGYATETYVSNSIINKVDKVIGKGLSTNDYTTLEKDKLFGISNNANNYVHPATHSADIIVDGITNKAYTDTEKTKLDGITTGADVSVNPDWNAVSGKAQILNKPNLDAIVPISKGGTGLTVIGSPNQILKVNSGGTALEYATTSESSSGTVTSIAVSAPIGFSVSGSPITTSGTIAISLTEGYSIPTIIKQSNWDSAYSWGNHSGLYRLISYVPSWSEVSNKPTTLGGYGITDAYTKTEVDTKLSSVYKYKGIVPTSADLPSTGMVLGDVWNVTDTNINYAWDGSVWDPLGSIVGVDVSLATPTMDGLLSATDFVKLSGIEANAEVNVNADWTSSTGDSQILNKPTTISGYGITDAYTKTQVDTSLSGKEATITAGLTSQYWRGDKSWQTLDKSTVGLNNVENTALSTWNGSSNINQVGTIQTGIWEGEIISLEKGGTGLNTIGQPNQILKVNSLGDGLEYSDASEGSSGTVTSVNFSAPIGFSISGAPITGSGIIALNYADGYSLPTILKQQNWDTAYGWGNHSELYKLISYKPAWSEIESKPTTLSGYGITDAQPSNQNLTSISNLVGPNGLLKKTGVDTWVLDNNTYITEINKIQVEEVLTGNIDSHNHNPSNINTDLNNRFVTDAEKNTWNNKQNSLSDNVSSHYHNSDRNRSNHSGNQLAATISDFAATVRSTVITGLSLATNAAIISADTILVALGKLQKQITDLKTTVTNLSTTVDREKGVNTVSTLTFIPVTKRLVTASVSTATNIVLAADMNVGEELHIIVYNSSASTIAQTIPNSGAFISQSGTTINILASSRIEINILCIATSTYLIRAV